MLWAIRIRERPKEGAKEREREIDKRKAQTSHQANRESMTKQT